jgi:hypothetical protein
MGTRGFVGFVVGGAEKIVYNHFDSYLSGLGLETLHWLLGELLAEADGVVTAWRTQAQALTTVPDREPTAEERERLAEFEDSGVGSAEDHWYRLLRETQGKPGAILKAGFYEDAKEFPLDSLFCEWGYLVDLDAEVLEVYQGFQTAQPTKGRWADEIGTTPGYAPVQLVARWSFKELPTDAAFLALGSAD